MPPQLPRAAPAPALTPQRRCCRRRRHRIPPPPRRHGRRHRRRFRHSTAASAEIRDLFTALDFFKKTGIQSSSARFSAYHDVIPIPEVVPCVKRFHVRSAKSLFPPTRRTGFVPRV
jgi:hypothetical protein